ncbi:MAG: AAA family ATPase, partial [Lachnospiraceae bacterium]|nr:AAA family ATPase [Lachnospiraceae bacterium]
MLENLRVENLALIEKEEIEFSEGLNVMTGETGAGKSIILGALDLALGGKINRGMVRDNEKDAFVEAVFSLNESEEEKLKESDL